MKTNSEKQYVWIVTWFRVDDCSSDAFSTFEAAEARAVELESMNMGFKGIRIFHKVIE